MTDKLENIVHASDLPSRKESSLCNLSSFVDGRLVDTECDERFIVINPSNGQPLLTIPSGCERDVDRAVSSARSAFADGRWSQMAPSSRKRVLLHFADLIHAQSAELDALDAAEMGKPVSVGFCNAAAAASFVRFNAESIDKLSGDVFSSDKRCVALQRRVPRGVVAAIVPWNFPTFNAALKIAPALVAGNAVVLKPSELSPRSAIRVAELLSEAGLPDGICNVVLGLGHTVSRALALHADIHMVAFTGSTVVGKLMLQYAGQSNMKAVHAECGGKSPQIVFADNTDVSAAAQTIADSVVINQGQVCSAGTRVLVHRSIHDELVERIRVRMESVTIGDALDPKTTFGPLVSASRCDRVMNYIESAAGDQANLVTGGRRTLMTSGGFFIEPTLFRDVSPRARIAQEEIFGPVLSVIPFEDEAEAVRIANATIYGLVAYVWTSNLSVALRVANGVRSSVIVNATRPTGEGAGHAASFEPVDQSGIGQEGGLAGIEAYMRRQTIVLNHS